VRTTRCKTQHHIALGDGFAGDQIGLFGNADCKAGEVVFARWVHAGHFGGFTADQSAAGQFATTSDAADDTRCGVYVQLSAREVIEEENRLGTLHQNVVHTHGYQILPDRIMTVELEGQLELGAYAVGAGHQHRFAEFLRHFEQRAKPADAAQHLRAHRALREWLDALDQRVAGIDIHACRGVTEGGSGVLGSCHDISGRNAPGMEG
jgi:hypothetical protein